MIEILLGSGTPLTVYHVVLDYNGTLSLDGELIAGVAERLLQLSEKLQLHVLTADTHGTVQGKVSSLDCTVHIVDTGNEDCQKGAYVHDLGPGVVAIGNGRNDTIMLANASIGIAMLQSEGLSSLALKNSDIVCTDINDALDLLLKPKRLVATLRN